MTALSGGGFSAGGTGSSSPAAGSSSSASAPPVAPAVQARPCLHGPRFAGFSHAEANRGAYSTPSASGRRDDPWRAAAVRRRRHPILYHPESLSKHHRRPRHGTGSRLDRLPGPEPHAQRLFRRGRALCRRHARPERFRSKFGGLWQSLGPDARWTNGPGYYATNEVGNGWIISQMPYITSSAWSSYTAVVTSGTNMHLFTYGSGSYTELDFLQDNLGDDTTTHEFTFLDNTGNALLFYDFNSSIPNAERGQQLSLKRMYTVTPRASLLVMPLTRSRKCKAPVRWASSTVTESYLYTYITSGTNAGLLSNVTLRARLTAAAGPLCDKWPTPITTVCWPTATPATSSRPPLRTAPATHSSLLLPLLRNRNRAATSTPQVTSRDSVPRRIPTPFA